MLNAIQQQFLQFKMNGFTVTYCLIFFLLYSFVNTFSRVKIISLLNDLYIKERNMSVTSKQKCYSIVVFCVYMTSLKLCYSRYSSASLKKQLLIFKYGKKIDRMLFVHNVVHIYTDKKHIEENVERIIKSEFFLRKDIRYADEKNKLLQISSQAYRQIL